MFVLRPIVVAMGACMLQACMTAPHTKDELAASALIAAPTDAPMTVAETPPLAVQPVMRVTHSANQSAATFYRLGKYHLEHGNLDFARSAYEASITMDGQQLEARNALAALDATQGKLDSAKHLLLQIVADFPDAAHPYNNLGYVYYLQSNFDAAQRTLQRAIALDAGNERARNNLSAVNIALARLEHPDMVKLSLSQPEQQTQLPLEIKPMTLAKVQAAPVESRTQGLAIISPPLEQAVADRIEPEARMEVVQIVPNIFELKLKHSNTTTLADIKLEKPQPVRVVEAVLVSSPVRAEAVKTSRIEVANGNGVTGMAKRISNVLNRQGISVSRLSNELPYKQLETKIHYRAGFENAAANLKSALKGHAVAVLTPTLSAHSDVRVVLGRDAITNLAHIEGMRRDTVLALNVLAD